MIIVGNFDWFTFNNRKVWIRDCRDEFEILEIGIVFIGEQFKDEGGIWTSEGCAVGTAAEFFIAGFFKQGFGIIHFRGSGDFGNFH